MMTFVQFLCIMSIVFVVEGTPLEVSNDRGWVFLSTLGVDLEVCNNLVYEVKGHADHKMSLMDRDGKWLIEVLIGGWYNTRSLFVINPTNKLTKLLTPSILSNKEFRWFWVSWGAGRFKFGKGKLPGENTIIDWSDPTGTLVKTMVLLKSQYTLSTIRLGETEGGRFVRVVQDGKFSDGMISESSTSRGSCASMCSKHVNCGMFSYNQDAGLCALFNRMTSSFTVTSEEGWRSWKLLYCYA